MGAAAVELGDLLHHGKTQAAAAVLPPGGVGLPEALPHLVQVLRGDADAVVGDAQLRAVVGAFQPQADVAPLPAVFVGVLQQVVDHPGDQRRVEPDYYPRLDLRTAGDTSVIFRHELVVTHLHKGAEVPGAHGVTVGSVVHPGQTQQLLHQLGHMPGLLLDHGHGSQKVLLGLVLPLGAVALGQDNGDGRAQLMGRVGNEAALRREGLLQPLKHPVKNPAQVSQLLGPVLQGQPVAQIAAVGNVVGGADHLLQWAEGQPGNQPAAAHRDQQQAGHDAERQDHNGVHQAGAVRGGDHAPDPEAGNLHVHIAVIDQVLLSVHCLAADHVGLHRQVYRYSLRHGTQIQLPFGAVEIAVYPPLIGVQVVPLKAAMVKFHAVRVGEHLLHQAARRVVGNGVGVDDQDKDQHHGRHQQHHQGKPQGHAHFQ